DVEIRELLALFDAARELRLDEHVARETGQRVGLELAAARLELIAHAEEKLVLRPRLGEVIVGVELKAVNLVLEGGFRGEEDHRDARGQRIGLELTADFIAVEA